MGRPRRTPGSSSEAWRGVCASPILDSASPSLLVLPSWCQRSSCHVGTELTGISGRQGESTTSKNKSSPSSSRSHQGTLGRSLKHSGDCRTALGMQLGPAGPISLYHWGTSWVGRGGPHLRPRELKSGDRRSPEAQDVDPAGFWFLAPVQQRALLQMPQGMEWRRPGASEKKAKFGEKKASQPCSTPKECG